ncbi:MAG TPA: DUF190 domain-containing protein, partial [Candidatus Eisenbacteria bacterium]|nr:DUF190 domain-containing protein [Candidatus Eisenbacteria bacterium]
VNPQRRDPMPIYQPARLLGLHLSEHDRYQGKPLHELIVAKCRELKIAGATVFRGHEGYGETSEIHRHHLLKHDLPLVINIIDTVENIDRLLPVIEGMMDKGLITVSDVQTIRVKSGGASHV